MCKKEPCYFAEVLMRTDSFIRSSFHDSTHTSVWLLRCQSLILLHPVKICSLVPQDVLMSPLVLWHLDAMTTQLSVEGRKPISRSYSYSHINRAPIAELVAPWSQFFFLAKSRQCSHHPATGNSEKVGVERDSGPEA